MKILLIKMSSMGDVFHAFPALSDALQNIPNLQVDWIVEKDFAQIPSWHPAVNNIYAIELRKWRKSPFKNKQQIKSFFIKINTQNYNLIIDAQGLLKSAWVMGKMKCANKVGFNWSSAREALASFWYTNKILVAKEQHAIWRLRELFYKALKYPQPNIENINYQLNTNNWQNPTKNTTNHTQKYAVFLHGTTWDTKLWPEQYWVELANTINKHNIKIIIPWGNRQEQQRAKRLQAKITMVEVPNNILSLNKMATYLKFAEFIVSVDTGLSHVGAALGTKMVVLYRVTNPQKVGAMGNKVTHLCSPIAQNYIKKFKNNVQEKQSLIGLEVEQVVKSLNLAGNT